MILCSDVLVYPWAYIFFKFLTLIYLSAFIRNVVRPYKKFLLVVKKYSPDPLTLSR